IPIKLVAKKA
ncbi:hypothetical protein MGQ_05140, partial [Candida albicans P76067]